MPFPASVTDLLWHRLEAVRALRFEARSTSPTGWTGEGAGQVTLSAPSETTLGFEEAGAWVSARGKRFPFHNVYRWTRLEGAAPRVRLEHLRFGVERPVHLFDLAPEAPTLWRSVAPHVCGNDRYTARLDIEPDVVQLIWLVKGPEKAERIVYRYD